MAGSAPPTTTDGAYLLGLIAADGSVQIEKDARGIVQGYKVTINCGAEPEDEPFAQYVTKLMEEVLQCPAKCRVFVPPESYHRRPCWTPIVYRKDAVEWVRERAPFTGTHDWVVPHFVSLDPQLLRAWISGFFDGDGHMEFDPPSRYASISSANRHGVEQVQRLMASLGIRTTGPYDYLREDGTTAWSLNVGARVALTSFRDQIGFRCQRKQAALEGALASYVREAPNLLSHQVKEIVPRVLELRARGEAFETIAKKLGLASTEVAKGMLKRSATKAAGKCLICNSAPATHSIPRVIRGRTGLYVCEPCLIELEPKVSEEIEKVSTSKVAATLNEHHPLGARHGKFALRNSSGVLVFSDPLSSTLPREWLELSRWCLPRPAGEEVENRGSQQWARVRAWLMENTEATTVVTYSDPSLGHDGALYRASGWLWAPSQGFILSCLGKSQRYDAHGYLFKNRWVFPLRPDVDRSHSLSMKHPYVRAKAPWVCEWPEPAWNSKGGFRDGGGLSWKRWVEEFGLPPEAPLKVTETSEGEIE